MTIYTTVYIVIIHNGESTDIYFYSYWVRDIFFASERPRYLSFTSSAGAQNLTIPPVFGEQRIY